ncbi:SDR family oxidoreductase [Aeoliella sp. ICT_H6.2]|uniref:SDR family oxidoreductase n=1 Tax=Aeoliella straminimaris TaxID=2954799 RepID=A0A9X2F896_9BACT|nr:SDR family oxidoreductase [Aeoliella straminimaris]MCO6044177.1 SDR family oxidoreductase [Aeoliella straminimaris]
MNCLILGATGAVGSRVARGLRSKGHQVFLAGRTEQDLAELSSELDSPYSVVNASEIEAVDQCVQAAHTKLGGLQGIVNCVGSVLIKPANITTAEEWHDTIGSNLTSAFAVVKSAANVMKDSGGSVILFSSAAAEIGLPNHEAIAAAKAGVAGLARSAAATYCSKGIRFNVIAPGLVKSKMTQQIWSKERSAEYSRKMHAVDRLGEPEDIASAVLWLIEPENSWITGSVFNIDGGLASVRRG